MNARLLTGSSLVAALKKAVDPAISASLQRNAERLRAALEEDRDAPSPHAEKEVGPQGRVRVYGVSGAGPKPSPAALRASTSPSGRGEGSGAPQGSGATASGLSLDIAIVGEAMFAREFGTLDAPADPVIAPAIDRLKRRSR